MPLLEVRGLVKSYGRRRVVDGVSFEVSAGEVVGLLGPTGAGKTTSFRMTTGQITPEGGQVWFDGNDVTHLPMFRRARLGMGYLSQETSVFRKLTVEQNILAILEIMPMMRTLGRRLTKQERWERMEQVLLQFGLEKVRKNHAARLSGGEKRRLEIARCLICEPLLILLDEPFTGIDPKTIADIQDIVRDLRAQGIGILLTDHNVREALKITTRSYLIKDGKVRTHGTPQEIIRDPIAINEYLGKSFNDAPFAPRDAIPIRHLEYAEAVEEQEVPEEAQAALQAHEPPVPSVLEKEKIHRLVEGLKTPDQALAVAELIRRGQAAVPTLLAALERRDVEMRRQSLQVLQNILKRPIPFDPYAPEILRRQQLAGLREQLERKAS
jgi:lipopolysaccharide export system ATP-binding protein